MTQRVDLTILEVSWSIWGSSDSKTSRKIWSNVETPLVQLHGFRTPSIKHGQRSYVDTRFSIIWTDPAVFFFRYILSLALQIICEKVFWYPKPTLYKTICRRDWSIRVYHTWILWEQLFKCPTFVISRSSFQLFFCFCYATDMMSTAKVLVQSMKGETITSFHQDLSDSLHQEQISGLASVYSCKKGSVENMHI